MPRELPVRIVQDPSHGFTRLPSLTAPPPDLTVGFDVCGEHRIRARLYGPAVPALKGTEHKVDLLVKPADVLADAARLRTVWKAAFTEFRPPTADGRPAQGRPEYPYADQADLRAEPAAELLKVVEELVVEGEDLLFGTLLAGNGAAIGHFREFLAAALSCEGLRVRFDSDLCIPWPMLCLRPTDVPGPLPEEPGLDGLFRRFLGHRHQIEQTGGSYPWPADEPARPGLPVVSLNHDTRIDALGLTRADEVGAALGQGTELRSRTTRDALLDALKDPDFDEQLMYFWCHGRFAPRGDRPPCLVIRLSDTREIDAHVVRRQRGLAGSEFTRFQPFVLLNACYAGMPDGDVDQAYLGRALIQSGARGVLGPQIEMPQVFAAEFALAFVTRYLGGEQTAGEVTHALARHFADEFRNPLGFAYALHCGMDSRLERTPSAATGQEQEMAV